MPVIQVSNRATPLAWVARLLLISALAFTTPVLLETPSFAAFAADDDDDDSSSDDKRKKKSIFGKLKSKVKERLPTKKDKPRAKSSSSSSSSSSSRKLTRVDARPNLVPRSAADEEAARKAREQLDPDRGLASNPKIRGFYEDGFEGNLIRTGGADPDRGRPGDPPNPLSPIPEDISIALSGASARDTEFAQSGEPFLTPAHANANQTLIRNGFLILPNASQMAALFEMSDALKAGVPFANIDVEIRATVADYLTVNEAVVVEAQDNFDQEKARSRLGVASAADRAERAFGAADNKSYPEEANYGAPPRTGPGFRDGAYDFAGEPAFLEDDDDDESDTPPPAPDEFDDDDDDDNREDK